MARVFSMTSPAGDALKFDSMVVDEGIGRMFEYTLDATSERGDLRPALLLGKMVTVKMEVPEKPVRYFSGYCARMQRGGMRGNFFSYTLYLRPWLVFLTRTSDCKIFQKKTIPTIIKEVFGDEPNQNFDERLVGSYEPWDYCVQYRETDFDFVSRLMEQEGIYYYFEHSAAGHKVVLCDSKSSHPVMAGSPVPYMAGALAPRAEKEYFSDWSEEQEIQPGITAFEEYDPLKPGADMRATRRAENPRDACATYELFSYPGEHDTRGEGDSYAWMRIESLHTRAEAYRGNGVAYGLAAGRKFNLTSHPQGDFNREYLLTEALLHFSEPQIASYEGEGTSITMSCRTIPAKQQFRSLRLTPKPTIHGAQTAEVVGPPGEEIYTDEYGRVKVQFHWDRYGKKDPDSSCWIRVATQWASANFGAISLPRIGDEVVVTFLEGDPDRPLVTGAVYNGDNKPPYLLPANKTQSGVKTKSEKGSPSMFNEMRFEDKLGSEMLFVQAQKDYQVMVKNDFIQHTKRDMHFKVERDALVHVDRRIHVKGDSDMMVQLDGALSLQSQELMVKSQQRMNVDAGQEVHIKGGQSVTIEAGAMLTLKVGGNFININPGGVFIQGTMVMINSGGSAGAGSGVQATSPDKAATNRDGADIAERRRRPPRPLTPSPAAQSLSAAASRGAPFAPAPNV